MQWNFEATRRNLAQQAEARRQSAAERAAVVRARLPACAATLREHFDVKEIWWFGSLARAEGRADSDVDLAVVGLAPERHMRANADIESLLGVTVDLVRWEEAPESLRQRIVEEGLPL